MTLSSWALSVFKTLPRRGKMAWNLRSLPCLAEPPADGPSTIYSSHKEASRSWQSANLPGRVMPSKAPFLKTASLAARAAKRALAASMTFSRIRLASAGFSSKYVSRPSLTTVVT